MEIKKGSRYVCIKDIVTYGTETPSCIKGNVYTGESDNCITNESGNNVYILKGSGAEKHFIHYSKLDRVYTKYTEKLEKLFDAYEGDKKRTVDDIITFFDNVAGYETGYFVAVSGLDELYYKDEDYTYLSEQAFIDFMELEGTVKEVFNPQSHYDNSKGSLYKVATERNWNAYIFDVVKRLERGGKKDPLKQEIEKSIDVLKIWLAELK